MKTTFTEDLENNKVIAVRTLNAPVAKVWNAWSHADILCQWWAPLPYTCKIDYMDFKEGGYWIYNLIGPEGDVHRGRMDYLKIVNHQRIEAQEYFCDEDGVVIPDFPPMQQEIKFESVGQGTKVTATTTYASEEAMRQMAEMGAAEGWELAMNQLEGML